MSSFSRALVITAVATGAAALALKWLQPTSTFPPPVRTPDRPIRPATIPEVDADAMTAKQQQALTDELDALL